MYQPMPTVSGAEYIAMSLTSGTNRWASRAVIILQLAAWSTVGVILLHKGMTSLRNAPSEAGNMSQPIETKQYRPIGTTKEATLLRGMAREEEGERRKVLLSAMQFNGNDLLRGEESGKPYPPTKLPKVAAQPIERSLDGDRSSSTMQTTTTTVATMMREGEKSARHRNSSVLHDDVLDKVEGEEEAEKWENKKRMRLSRVSGGGAAAAVAMVAVGAVMLILGPAVVVLRALDERRQERRFSKLSGQDDPPPTYEQATLMDEAPRYSSLSLDTIHQTESLSTSTTDQRQPISSTACLSSGTLVP